MRRLTEDNAARLQRIGAEVDPANLYIMHHLGTGDGPKVLRAAPDTPLSSLLSEKIIDVNPYMKGMTVGDFVSWARERMGQERGAIDAPAAIGAGDDQMLAALETERAQVEAERMAAQRDLDLDNEAATPAAIEEPPLADNMIRVYHSGAIGDGETGRWVSTDRQYASDYRSDLPLHYTDLPANDPRVNNADWPDQNAARGFTFNFELSAQEAARLTEIRRSRAPVDQEQPMLRRDQFASEEDWRSAQGHVDDARRGADPSDAQMAAADAVIGKPAQAWELRLGDQVRLAGSYAGVRRAAAEMAQRAGVLDEHFDRIMKWRGKQGDLGPLTIAKRTEPATIKEALAAARNAQETQVAPMPEAMVQRYIDPAAAETKAQADSFTHDVAASVDAGQWQAVPFAVDAQRTVTPEQLMLQLDDEDAALAAMRGCL